METAQRDVDWKEDPDDLSFVGCDSATVGKSPDRVQRRNTDSKLGAVCTIGTVFANSSTRNIRSRAAEQEY
jgi:hypothetical protein